MYQDRIIIEMYVTLSIPCDRIVSNPAVLREFTEEYTARTGHIVEPADLGQHLLNLRKRGGDKGGLPRMRRLV